MRRHTSWVGHFRGVSGSDAIATPNQVSLSCLLRCTSVQTWTLEFYFRTRVNHRAYTGALSNGQVGIVSVRLVIRRPAMSNSPRQLSIRVYTHMKFFHLKVYVFQLRGVH